MSLPQPLLAHIIRYMLRADNQEECDGSHLRLVSRQFNDEVLRLWFITRQADPPRHCANTHEHNDLLARRHILGFLFREVSNGSKCSSISISLTEAISRVKTLVPSEKLPSNSIDSILGDGGQHFLCGAFASLYRTNILMENARKQPLTSTIVDLGQKAWFLTAACKLGDPGSIQTSFAEFDSGPLTAETKRSFLLSCLCAAICGDWQQAFDFLLKPELNVDLNADDPSCRRSPIRIATECGRVTYLRKLFQQGNRLRPDNFTYERAIASAASYPDQCVRRQLVYLFIEERAQLLSREMKKELLYGACQRNDSSLAALVLEPGDVDVFTSQSFLTGRLMRRCALTIAAIHNSVACTEMILKTCRSSGLQKPDATRVITAAFRLAAKHFHLEMLKLLLPYESQLQFTGQFLCMARVDGGLAAMEAFYGSDCIRCNRDVRAADAGWSRKETSLGGEALRLAVWYRSPSNIWLLLHRGVVPTGTLSARPVKPGQNVVALQVIEELLENQGHKLSFC